MSPPIVFFDLETRSKCDLKKHGSARYFADPSTTILLLAAWFPGDVRGVWANPDFMADMGDAWVKDRWNKWVQGGGLVVAWNAAFDRRGMEACGERLGLAVPRLGQVLDAEALAENYNLPGKLAAAADALRVPTRKDTRGKALISALSDGNKPWQPERHTLEAFIEYAIKDVGAMREVWLRCRPWAAQEWADYHVVERINDRGMQFRVDFARVATKFANLETDYLDSRLKALTGDPGMSLSAHKRKAAWLAEQLADTTFYESLFKTSKRKRQTVTAISAAKDVQAKLRERLLDVEDRAALPEETAERVVAFLEVLHEGNGVAAKKFAKVVDVEVGGRVYNQFRCSPTQTGRHASRGVQFDNIVRDKLPGDGDPALQAIQIIMDGHAAGRPLREISAALEARFKLPFQKVLARLIRPSIIAREGFGMVWGDWSSIEGRTLPWLAKDEPALNVYRRGECNYSKAAAAIYGGDWRDIYAGYKAEDPEMTARRQTGKVAELALGFGGGFRAFKAMAANYGVKVSDARAEEIKVRWREANTWAVRFWRELNDAAWEAYEGGGRVVRVGRVSYRRVGRDLWAVLPDGRPVVYPEIRGEDKYKEAWDQVVPTLTYRKIWQGGVVRGELYGGILAENVTQAAAASLLRDLMRRLDARGCAIIGTTHDEVRIESADPEADAAMLKTEMETNPGWAAGLPLKAAVSFASYYGK